MNKRYVIVEMALLSLLLIAVVVAGGSIVYANSREAAQDISNEGIVIAQVKAGGPAAEAGLVRGDILLEIDDQKIDDAGDLLRYLKELESGDEVALTVLHGDDERTLTATLGEQNSQPYLGLVPCGGLPEANIVHIFPERLGAVIVEVVADSPADEAGLEKGDRILAVDGQELDDEHNLSDLIATYEPGDTVTLEVQRPDDDEPQEISVTLGQHSDDEDKAFLGVSYLPLPRAGTLRGEIPLPENLPLPWPSEGNRLVFPPKGAVIYQVEPDGPAAEAELQKGDIITAVDGEEIKSAEDLLNVVAAHAPGDTLTLTLHRINEDQPMEVAVTLGQHPDDEDKAYLGVRLEHSVLPEGWEEWLPPMDQPFFESERFVFPPDTDVEQGAVVMRIAEGSPADEAGLQQGDIITAINGEPVESPGDLTNAVAEREPGDKITLTIHRSGEEEQEIEVTLAENADQEGAAYLGATVGGFYRGFFSPGRIQGSPLPGWMGPLRRLFGLENRLSFGEDEGETPGPFWFRMRPGRFFDFGQDDTPRRFEFDFSPDIFEQEPCCSEENVL
jgi:S1-C subfamily serine protease